MFRIKSRPFFFLSILITLVVCLLQYRTTKPTDFFKLNEIERIEQLKHMNEYPPSTYRLANWVEARPEAVIYFKLEKNFISIFDLNYFFGGLYLPFLFPFFVYGFLELLKKWTKELLILSLIPISVVTLIGNNNSLGLFCFYPLILVSVFYSLYLCFKFVTGYEK